MADIIPVLPDETIDSLLTKITARAGSGPAEPVLLWVPRGVRILHQMEDFQALKGVMRRQGVQITILSPDARVVGLGKVFGVEAETAAQPPGPAAVERPPAPGAAPAPADSPGAPDARSAVAGAPRPGTAPLPPPAAPPAAPRRPITSPLPAPAPAVPPAPEPAPGLSETDWLLGDGGNLDALLNDAQDTGRSATPPPDVLLPGMAPRTAPPPAAAAGPPPAAPAPDAAAPSDTDWLTAGVDLAALAAESLNPAARPAPPPADQQFVPPAPPASQKAPAAPFAGASVPPPDLPAVPPAGPQSTDPFTASFEQVPPFYMDPEPPPPPPAAPPASEAAPPPAESFSLSDLLQAGEEEGGGPPMSFAEWLASQGSGTGVGAGHPAPPPVDLANLPAWMRPEPPAPAAQDASTPARPRPPAAGRKGVLRCPHCGEELDKEEMLRMLAEVWGLDS